MKRKSDEIEKFLIGVMSDWQGVDCICVSQRSDTDEFDPRFALVLDVYFRRGIPAADRREKLFDNPGAFESSQGTMKDRFFLDEIPIRVEYKHIPGVQDLVERPLRHIKLIKNAGTYPLYRLLHFKLAYSRSDWIERMRESLSNFPKEAWDAFFYSFSAKMEHYLADLGAASVSDNPFFLLVSKAGFLRFAGASIYMHNHAFEPSHSEYENNLRKLPRLPANFKALWEGISSDSIEMAEFRRFELARVLAREILELR